MPRQVVCVEDSPYNAVGDGVADDTNAIKAAIAAGKGIYCPGTYKVTDEILVATGQDFVMYGDSPASNVSSTDSTKDVFRFTNNGGQHLAAHDLCIIGGKSSLHLNGTVVDKTSKLSNLILGNFATAGLEFDGSNSFINGTVDTVHMESLNGMGIYAHGSGCLNAARFASIYVGSIAGDAVSIQDTGDGTYALKIDGLTVESAGKSALVLDGVTATILGFYMESNGRLVDVADIRLLNSAYPALFTKCTLISPYFGPLGSARTGTKRVNFGNSAITLNIYGLDNAGVQSIDTNGHNAGSYINLFGTAANMDVLNDSGTHNAYGGGTTAVGALRLRSPQAFISGDKYLVLGADNYLHLSLQGPSS